MPIYNREAFLNKSIESVLNQQFPNFELICVNDASTDTSKEIVESYVKKDKRVVLIDLLENQGRCIARNKGIEAARGEWICFLDSDDVYLPNHLSEHFSLIEKYPNNKAFSTEQSFSGVSKKYQNSNLNNPVIKLSLQDFIEDNPISLNQLSYHRSLSIFFPNKRITASEDWFFLRLITLKVSLIKSNILTTDVTEHEDRSINTHNWMQFVKSNAQAGQLFAQNNLPQPMKNHILSFTYLLCTNILLSKGKMKRESLAYLRKSLAYKKTYFHPLFYKALIKYLLP